MEYFADKFDEQGGYEFSVEERETARLECFDKLKKSEAWIDILGEASLPLSVEVSESAQNQFDWMHDMVQQYRSSNKDSRWLIAHTVSIALDCFDVEAVDYLDRIIDAVDHHIEHHMLDSELEAMINE